MSSQTQVLSIALALAAVACNDSGGVVEAGVPEPLPEGAVVLPAAPGPLRDYSWDGIGRVPWLSAAPPRFLLPGELGRTPLTGVYLTFNADAAAEAALQPAGWSAEAGGLASCPGRFGTGVQLGPGSVLRCQVAPGARSARAWTLEFWLRPQLLAQRDLLAVPGVLTLDCAPDGRLGLELQAAGPDSPVLFRHPSPLVEREWNHVGVVLDLEDARSVRLVVNGQAQGCRIAPDRLDAALGELVLGDVQARSNGLECRLDEVRFETRNASTAELSGHWQCERRSLEHLRLTRATAAEPARLVEEELELWREPLTDARLDSAAEWARGELVHAFASDEGLSWTAEHWREVECPDSPVARTTHPVVSLGGRRVFTFGGETRDTHLGPTANTNDTWIFDGASGRWSRLQTSVAPSPRCHVPAAYSPDHDLVLLVGGWWIGGWWGEEGQQAQQVYGDTWVFRVSEQRWEQRKPGGAQLKKVSDNGLVYLPELRRFLMLLARHSLLYDPEADLWESLPSFEVVDEQGRPAERRTVNSPCCALDPATGQVLVFGGSYGRRSENFADATGLYDPRSNRFTVLDPARRPPARVRAGLAHDPVRGRFVLFGGVRDQFSQRFDDLWTFDPRTRQWSEVERGALRPSARGGYYGMAYDEVADHFVLPGGRHAPERWLDETWTLELDERRSGTARYVFDRATFPGQVWFAESEVPAGAEVRFRFKTSPDGLCFGDWEEECPATGRFVQVEVRLAPGPGGVPPRVRAMGFRGPT